MTTASCSASPQATCSRITRRVSFWMPGVCREDLRWSKSTWEKVCIAPCLSILTSLFSSHSIIIMSASCVVAAYSDHRSDHHCPGAKTATAILRRGPAKLKQHMSTSSAHLAAWQAPALAILLYHLWPHEHSLVKAPMAVSWCSYTTHKAPK